MFAITYACAATAWIGIVCAATPMALAVEFDSDDFIISSYYAPGRIAVFESDFTFKGYLPGTSSPWTGMDFDSSGNVVAVAHGPTNPTTQGSMVRVYNSAGQQIGGFSSNSLGIPIDLKVGPNGNYYIGGQYEGGLMEVSPGGTVLRTFSPPLTDYEGVAVLPNNVLWGGGSDGNDNFLNIFDIATGLQTGSIGFDNGQTGVTSMFYSASTNSVLMCDKDTGAAYERDVSTGAFIRSFRAPGLGSPRSITRGPNGDVFVGDNDDHGVYRWSADGTFQGFTSLSPTVTGPSGILWAGNIPEPAALSCCAAIALPALAQRRRSPSPRPRM